MFCGESFNGTKAPNLTGNNEFIRLGAIRVVRQVLISLLYGAGELGVLGTDALGCRISR